MIALTFERPTWAHRLPAGAKFAGLFAATLLIVAAGSLPLQVAILAAVAGLYLSCGADFARAGLRALRGLVLVAVLIGLWHGLTGNPQTGALVVMRLFASVAAATFVTMTTRLDEITALIDRLLAALRVPPAARRRLALAVALTIRFIPVLADKGARLTEAWRARSARRLSPRIVLPMALLALDDAEQVAEALRARGGT